MCTPQALPAHHPARTRRLGPPLRPHAASRSRRARRILWLRRRTDACGPSRCGSACRRTRGHRRPCLPRLAPRLPHRRAHCPARSHPSHARFPRRRTHRRWPVARRWVQENYCRTHRWCCCRRDLSRDVPRGGARLWLMHVVEMAVWEGGDPFPASGLRSFVVRWRPVPLPCCRCCHAWVLWRCRFAAAAPRCWPPCRDGCSFDTSSQDS